MNIIETILSDLEINVDEKKISKSCVVDILKLAMDVSINEFNVKSVKYEDKRIIQAVIYLVLVICQVFADQNDNFDLDFLVHQGNPRSLFLSRNPTKNVFDWEAMGENEKQPYKDSANEWIKNYVEITYVE